MRRTPSAASSGSSPAAVTKSGRLLVPRSTGIASASPAIGFFATPTIDDNRISYGCINIPADFFDAYVRPAYARRNAVVYVLPEVRPLTEVFAMDSAAATRLAAH